MQAAIGGIRFLLRNSGPDLRFCAVAAPARTFWRDNDSSPM